MKRKVNNRPILLIILTILIVVFSFFTFNRMNKVNNIINNKANLFNKDSNIILNDLKNIKEEILNNKSNLEVLNGNPFDKQSNKFYFNNYKNKLYLTFYNSLEDKTYIKDFNDYNHFINKDVNNYFVVDKNSKIYYKYNETDNTSLITIVNDTKKLDNALLKDYITYIDKDLIISMYKLDDTFTLTEIMSKDDLITPLYKDLLVYSGFVIAISIIIYSLHIYTKYKRKDIYLDLSNLVFNELKYVYLIEINKDGKILNFNKLMEKTLKKRVRHINEITNEKFVLKDLVLNINEVDYLFKLYQVNEKYFLINDTGVEIIDQQNKLLHYNEITNFKNLRSFYKYIEKTNETNTYFILDIKNFKGLRINQGQKISNELTIELLNYLNDQIKIKEKEIYHIKIDVFIIMFKNKNVDSELILNQIINFSNQTSEKYKIELDFNVAKLYNEDIKGYNIYETLIQILNVKKQNNERNILEYNTSILNKIKRDELIQTSLIKAVENNEFEMYYQPILNLNNNKVRGFEALMGWDKASELEISVEKYIEVLGNSNLIYDITTLSIKEVVKFIKLSDDKNVNVSFNVTPKQFLEQGFINKLTNEIYKSKIDPSQISIEITENVFTNEFKIINNKIKTLKSLGVKVFLDDFGTGYSSFKYLNDLDIDVLKLDRSFILNIDKDVRLKQIVSGIIDLSNKLNLDVIAEGVENKEELQILKDLKCNYVQGFLISKALNYKEALKLINKKYNL